MLWSRRRLVGLAVAAAFLLCTILAVFAARGAVIRLLQSTDLEFSYTRVGLRVPAGLRLDELRAPLGGEFSAERLRVGVPLVRLPAAASGDPAALRLLFVRSPQLRLRSGIVLSAESIRLRRVPGGNWDLRIRDPVVDLSGSASTPPGDAGAGAGSGATAPGETSLLGAWELLVSALDALSERIPPTRLRVTDLRIVGATGIGTGDLRANLHESGALDLSLDLAALPLPALSSIATGGLGYASVQAHVEGDGSARAAVALRSPGLVVFHPRLADAPVGPLDVSYRFSAELDPLAAVPEARLARRIPGTSDPPPPGAGDPGDALLRGALHLRDGEFSVNGVDLGLSATLFGLNCPRATLPFPAPARVDFRAELAETELGALVAAVPDALLGPLAEVEADGSLAWRISGEAPLHALSWTRWEAQTDVSNFNLLAIPDAVDVRRLAQPFAHRYPAEDGEQPQILIGEPTGLQLRERGGIAEFRLSEGDAGDSGAWLPVPGLTLAGGQAPGSEQPAGPDGPDGVDGLNGQDALNNPEILAQGTASDRFVALQDISPAVLGAVITTEDSEFLNHNGVNWQSLMFAFQINLEAGEILSGGSTIPMQLAKNLFLDQSRILSRKLQELALVALMNLAGGVSRARILEIYLNVIELGPGIYGIREAADVYFGVHPRDLRPEQAVWLASIIKSPRRFWVHARDGEVPEPWLREMANFLRIMYVRGRISVEDYKRSAGVQPEFAEWPLFNSDP